MFNEIVSQPGVQQQSQILASKLHGMGRLPVISIGSTVLEHDSVRVCLFPDDVP